VIFGRRGGSGRHARAGDARRSTPRHSAAGRREDEDAYEAYEDGYDNGYGDAGGGPAHGPYDVDEAPDNVTRLDLGSLLIPAVDGVEVRVQANPEGEIQQVVLVNGPSALQLGVFAAPRSEGIWDEVRTEIRKSLFNDGVAAEEVDGDYGVELRARVRTPDGLADIRFVGVDGPRWMVRGVFQGPAATDPAQAGALSLCLRELVVVRGQEAKPIREPLPLRLPKEVADQAAADAAGGAPAGPGGVPPVNGGALGQPVQSAQPVQPGQTDQLVGPADPAGSVGPAGAAGRPGGSRRRPSPRPRRS
jgi:hypothetical protein